MKKWLVPCLLSSIVVLLLHSGCKSDEYYRQKRIERAEKHFEKIATLELSKGKVFTLPECVRLCLKRNLDLQVFTIRQEVTKEQRTAAMLGMMPTLEFGNTFTSRNNVPARSAKHIASGSLTFPASQSFDKTINDFYIEAALSLMDFGLAFLNTIQAQDRNLITGEQRRRAGQNLTLDVAKAYFRVAATQDAIEITEQLLVQCRAIQKVLSKLAQTREISVMRALDERKRFIRLEKRLIQYRRNYQDACIRLRSLMGFDPTEEIKVDTTCLSKFTDINVPDIETLELIAMIERPELYEIDLNANVILNEARKAILQMFPNVQIFVKFENNDNHFLYYQNWWQVGAGMMYNVLKIPQQIARYKALDTQYEETMAKTLSLSIGVMAQVRIAHANMAEVRERYLIDERVYRAYSDHLKIARSTFRNRGALSKLELDRLELETAETQIDRTLSLGNYYLSYYRLLNTMGMRDLAPETMEYIKGEVAKVKAKQSKLTEKQKRAFDKAIKRLKSDIEELKQKQLQLQTGNVHTAVR